MGLDGVEFLQAVEDAFGVVIPNEIAPTLTTPGLLAAYLESRLRTGTFPSCPAQRAFYRLRAAGQRATGQSRNAIRPSTPWADVLGPHPDTAWHQVGTTAGIAAWPRRTYLFGTRSDHKTIGDTARYLASTLPHTLLDREEGWSRSQIEATLSHLMAQELGILTFRWTERFVQDLGID